MIGYSVQKSLQWFLIFVVVLFVSGCFGRSSPKVTYYSLLNMKQLGETQSVTSLPEIKLGIGPITIPDSLKRSQVVTRQHGNQYEFDEFNRWAGILEKDLTSVLGDNLGQLLGVEQIGFFPWMPFFEPSYRVFIDVLKLDGAIDGEAVLSVRWAISDTDGKTYIVGKKSDYSQPLEDASYAALIKAESQLVAELSKEIAGEIAALVKSLTFCSEPRPQVCTMDYQPVCAELKEGGSKTYSNGCSSCSDPNVVAYRQGACAHGK